MKLIKEEKFNKLIADKGKRIRTKDDVYIPAHYDEEGNYIEEHIPSYFIKAYVPKKVTEINMYDKYIEEPEEDLAIELTDGE